MPLRRRHVTASLVEAGDSKAGEPGSPPAPTAECAAAISQAAGLSSSAALPALPIPYKSVESRPLQSAILLPWKGCLQSSELASIIRPPSGHQIAELLIPQRLHGLGRLAPFGGSCELGW